MDGPGSQLAVMRPATTWRLIKSYWQSPGRARVWLIYVIMVLMTIALVGVDVIFNYWYNFFYNALQAYDKHETIRLLIYFFIFAGIYIVIAVYRYYISQRFGLYWRKWLTEQFITRWLQKRSYYYLENFDENTDNPDQRIQEDVGSLVTSFIDLSLGLISAICTFFAFVYVLWELSGVIDLHVWGLGTVKMSGYLVWVGLIYALVGTLFTFKIGRPLVPLNFEQQRREATFRFAAIDLRAHAEHIALYRGEQHQKSILDRLLGRVLDNWYMIILRQKTLLWFTASYNQISVALPLLVALPHYFDKVFLLGGLIQTIQAFGRVQDALSFIVNSYPNIAQWQAVNKRLTTFANHITSVETAAEEQNHLVFHQHPQDTIYVQALSINTPRGKPLLKNINETFTHGQHYLIKGRSGIGKSTFVRTLAGIWPFATGEVTNPQNKQIMYLPQKPYMPIGTLAEAILFPDKEHPEQAEKLQIVLKECALEQFIPRLQDTASWSEQLSPGEQQRIAFARVLLHKPDWVFLDESTSMLDAHNEKRMYELLKTQLPDCTVISVGHRGSLEQYHDHVVDMAQYS
jgi:putative ATP-binding cassette transporter